MPPLSDLSLIADCVAYWKNQGFTEVALPWNPNTSSEALAAEMLTLFPSPSVTWTPFVSMQERGMLQFRLEVFVHIPSPAPEMTAVACHYMNWLNTRLRPSTEDLLSLKLFSSNVCGIYAGEKELALFQLKENGSLFGKVAG